MLFRLAECDFGARFRGPAQVHTGSQLQLIMRSLGTPQDSLRSAGIVPPTQQAGPYRLILSRKETWMQLDPLAARRLHQQTRALPQSRSACGGRPTAARKPSSYCIDFARLEGHVQSVGDPTLCKSIPQRPSKFVSTSATLHLMLEAPPGGCGAFELVNYGADTHILNRRLEIRRRESLRDVRGPRAARFSARIFSRIHRYVLVKKPFAHARAASASHANRICCLM